MARLPENCIGLLHLLRKYRKKHNLIFDGSKALNYGRAKGVETFILSSLGFAEIVGADGIVAVDIDKIDSDIASIVAVSNTYKKEIGNYRREAVKFVNEFIENVAYPDNYFDWIISSNVEEHIQDLPKAFANCFRMLKPGGYQVINTGPMFYCKNPTHISSTVIKPWEYLELSDKEISERCSQVDREEEGVHSFRMRNSYKFYIGLNRKTVAECLQHIASAGYEIVDLVVRKERTTEQDEKRIADLSKKFSIPRDAFIEKAIIALLRKRSDLIVQ